jgi:hypothetical protein
VVAHVKTMVLLKTILSKPLALAMGILIYPMKALLQQKLFLKIKKRIRPVAESKKKSYIKGGYERERKKFVLFMYLS